MNTFRKNLLYRMFGGKPENEEKTDLCNGCLWRDLKRHQKCSCCRRNKNLKDNYVLHGDDAE